MVRIAKRLQGISASPTMAVMQEAQTLKKQGIDVIDFGPGEPDFPTPEPVKDAARQAIADNLTKYTAAAGILELRRAVADKYNREWGSRFSEANVVITCGAKHAIYDVCMASFEEGDEVVIPSPYWVTFPEVVKMADATPVDVATRESDGFVLKTAELDSHATSATRGLILNSPNNPTGAVVPEEEMKALAGWCRQRSVLLLSDETYEYFVYEGRRHTSLASTVDPDEDFYAIVGSVSKTYSMTGWRIGYVLAHPMLIKKIAAFQSHQTGNPTSISQWAALAALGSDSEMVEEMRREYSRRRRVVLEGLAEIPGFRCAAPYGAFYAFPNVEEALHATGSPDSESFARFLIQEARVATVPGSAFGIEGYIRLSYATSMENLREGLRRIKEAVEKRAALAGS